MTVDLCGHKLDLSIVGFFAIPFSNALNQGKEVD